MEAMLSQAIADVSEDHEVFGAEGPCPLRLEPPSGAPKVLLITGENASGKSLLCRFLSLWMSQRGVEVMPLSMRFRSQSGMGRAMVYGDESWQSTGEISMRSALRGFDNLEGDQPRCLVLDEPDIGLSEAYAKALGDEIAAACRRIPESSPGAVIVTHSRAIAAAVAALGPWAARVGDDLRPTAEWLRDGPLPLPPGALEHLSGIAVERFRRVSRIMDERKAAARNAKQEKRDAAERALKAAEADYAAKVRAAPSGDGGMEEARAAAGSYLAAALDHRAVQGDKEAGFSVADGRLMLDGEHVAEVALLPVAAGNGRVRFVARIGDRPERFPMSAFGLDDACRAVFRLLPSPSP